MSIKIVPQDELEKANSNMSIIRKTPLLFYPVVSSLYARRYQRLQTLTQNNPFGQFIEFCSKIIAAQNELIKNHAITEDLHQTVALSIEKQLPPLSLDNYPLTSQWLIYLKPLLIASQGINEQIEQTINEIQSLTDDELMSKANMLLKGEFNQVPSNQSLFIWSALSVYYSQLASQLPAKAIAEFGEKRWLCPVCNSHPIASVIHLGQNVGLRYLHCSLCESEWHVPRVKCTNCDNMQDITYYALEDELSATKTECCPQCNSYLKIFNQDRDPHLDVIADDIATLPLDMETEKLGFAKSGINPFLLQAE